MCLAFSMMQTLIHTFIQCGETIVTLAAHCMVHVLITSTMGNFAAWFAGRLTCDSNKVSNSQDFED